VRDLSTYFFTDDGAVKAVDHVSFEIERGEVLGVVGESGSGKSALALSILRLIPDPPGRIVGGEILFMEKSGGEPDDLCAASERRLRQIRGNRIAMIFQDPMTALNPYLRVGEQLTEVLELHKGMSRKEARARSVEMLAASGIPAPSDRIDDYPHQLSGGMRQRVLIAMALLCDPSLLIADEPTTALDVTIQAQILDLISERKEALGAAVILITHDLGVVAKMADRVAVMYAGKIVEEGPVDAIFEAPKHPYTIALARSIPRIEGARGEALVPIAGMPPTIARLSPGCPFQPRCDRAIDICKSEDPAPRTVGKGEGAAARRSLHVVRCHVG
jgi:peptide/nickel transport system ATP-binding protein/oligopeptide transport system ATP-binding protein